MYVSKRKCDCIYFSSVRISLGSSVELISSVEEAGRSKACPGETVVFTCTIQATVLLEWRTGPTEMGLVQFIPQHLGTGDGSDDIGEFHAVLTQAKHNGDDTYTMQSTLSVTANDIVDGTTVTCTDRVTSVSNRSQLLLQGERISYTD